MFHRSDPICLNYELQITNPPGDSNSSHPVREQLKLYGLPFSSHEMHLGTCLWLVIKAHNPSICQKKDFFLSVIFQNLFKGLRCQLLVLQMFISTLSLHWLFELCT
jgi:hypothetical protein